MHSLGIKDIIIVVLAIIIIMAFLQTPSFDKVRRFHFVNTEMMVPSLYPNDVALIIEDSSFEDVKINDIIVFNRPLDDKVTFSRVVDTFSNVDGNNLIRTKGDAYASSIPGTDYPISKDKYIGKVDYYIPGLNRFVDYFSSYISHHIKLFI